jgi:hypothetical protein
MRRVVQLADGTNCIEGATVMKGRKTFVVQIEPGVLVGFID